MSVVLGCRHGVGEGDRERVERWLPAHGPSCLPGALGLQRSGDQVAALQGGLLGGEVLAHGDRSAVPGVLCDSFSMLRSSAPRYADGPSTRAGLRSGLAPP